MYEKLEKTISLFLKIKEAIIIIAAIVAVVVNAWFVGRITPYAARLEEHDRELKAQAQVMTDHKTEQKEDIEDLKVSIQKVDENVIRVKDTVEEINRYLRK